MNSSFSLEFIKYSVYSLLMPVSLAPSRINAVEKLVWKLKLVKKTDTSRLPGKVIYFIYANMVILQPVI